jgi:hypothetical protein
MQQHKRNAVSLMEAKGKISYEPGANAASYKTALHGSFLPFESLLCSAVLHSRHEASVQH